ncbi:hypothetical protein BpHYR1_000966 [Brachionus plicatilis]|uniref:Uncharacterized protein n=1 Tax=Brachionus plicatilis TaxID=10195 RepID=A0A3M7T3C8_BRAPC|nr:hypothetical protein BpHYR1_000966 [Brachionus plicatilis]
METIHGERLIRTNFTSDSSLPDNFFNFTLFDINDLTVAIIQPNESYDNLIEYIIANQVELLVSINMPIDLRKNLRRTELSHYQEKEIASSPSINCVKKKKKIEFNVNLEELGDLKSKNFDFSLKYTELNSNLKTVKRESNTNYADQSIESILCCLNEIINEKKNFQERMILVSSEIKLAAILAISFVNYRQAQIEGTINVNMSSQTVLSKLPTLTSDQAKGTDFSTSFKPYFSLEDYELIYKVSSQMAETITESRAKRKVQKVQEEKFISI